MLLANTETPIGRVAEYTEIYTGWGIVQIDIYLLTALILLVLICLIFTMVRIGKLRKEQEIIREKLNDIARIIRDGSEE